MANEKVAGVNVLVSIGEKVIGGQSSASLSRSANMVETTDKTSGGWVSKVAGLKEWSVECEAFMIVGDAAYGELSKAFNDGKEVDVSLSTGTGVGHIKFSGKALISDLPMEFGAEDAVTFTTTFEGTGPLVEVISKTV